MSSQIKQALVLAGGKSSRFSLFSSKSKLSLNLMGRSILDWTLVSLKNTGIKDIVVVVNSQEEALKKIVEEFIKQNSSLKVTLVVQNDPKGMADAILCAQDKLTDRFVVVNGSQFNADQLIEQLEQIDSSVVISCQKTNQPELYGIVKIDGQKAISLQEKPQDIENEALRVVSAYVLTKGFVDFMAQKEQQEYLLESALDEWMKQNNVLVNQLKQPLPSLKYPWHLLELKNLLFDKLDFSRSEKAFISPSAIIKGDVFIGADALIGDYAIIEGPAYIGKGAVVGRYSVMRGGSILEANAEVQSYVDVNNSVIMSKAHIHSGFIGDSIIGEEVRIGANFTTANRRLDRKEIKVDINNKSVSANTTRLGAMVGHQAKLGINVSTMPGVIVESRALVSPGTCLFDNYQSK